MECFELIKVIDTMRLNKFMASAGVASRRKCDEIIEEGRVRVNAQIVKKLGIQVNPDKDLVSVDNKPVRLKNDCVYIMINKPTGVVTTVRDPYGRCTVLDILPKTPKRIYPIGRLDYNTSGLLLLTNDGDTAQKIIHPSFELNKVYLVTVRHKLNEQQISKLCKGVDIGGFVTSPAKVVYKSTQKGDYIYEVVIHEGKNRQIRRMFSAVGSNVVGLQRIAIGKLKLGSLPVGAFRELTQEEVNYILKLGEKD